MRIISFLILFFLVAIPYGLTANPAIIWGSGGYAKNLAASGIELESGQTIDDDTTAITLSNGLNVTGTTTLNTSLSGVAKLSSGVVSAGSVDVASEVSGILPIANGGTNSSTALNNDFVMISSGGAIVEDSNVSTTELGYLDNVTSNIQTQLNAKLESVDLTSDVTGILPIANGGTGSATQNFVDLTTNQSIAGVKTFTEQYVAVSTTNGSRPCPVMTETQKNNISAPSEGDCVVDSTNAEVNYYLDGEWTQVGGGGGSAGINFISDNSFEDGELDPDTTTAGLESYEIYTVNADLYSEFNLQHFQVDWSSLSSADAYARDSFARTGLDDKQGLFSIWIKSTTVSDQDLQLCLRVDDSDYSETCDDAYLITITSDDTWRKYEIPFVFGASTVEYEIFNESYTGALEINIDKIYIGTIPDGYIQSINNVDTDWVSYTPSNTQGFGSITNNNLEYRRVGDSLEVRGYFDCGTVTAVEAQIELPNALVIKDGTQTSNVGTFLRDTTTTAKGGAILSTGGDSFVNFSNLIYSDLNQNPLSQVTANLITANGERISIEFSVPIQGWSTGRTEVVNQQTELTAETANRLTATFTDTGSCNEIEDDFNFVASCTRSATGTYDIVFESNIFTNKPAIHVSAGDGASREVNYQTLSTTGFTVVGTSSGSLQDLSDFTITVTKTGADVNKSINVVGKFANINDTPLCKVKANSNDGSAVSTTTGYDFTIETEDNCNAFDGNAFTAPRSSKFFISGLVRTTSTASYIIDVFLNGTKLKSCSSNTSGFVVRSFNCGEITLASGDVVTIRPNSSLTQDTTDDENTHHISITELPDLSAIVKNLSKEDATVAARYTTNTTTSLNATPSVIPFEDLDFDTHNAYNTSTGVYTAPVSGYYRINATITSGGTSWSTSNSYWMIKFYKNGSEFHQSYTRRSSTGSTALSHTASTLVYLAEDETCSVYGQSNISTNLAGVGNINNFSISRIK